MYEYFTNRKTVFVYHYYVSIINTIVEIALCNLVQGGQVVCVSENISQGVALEINEHKSKFVP